MKIFVTGETSSLYRSIDTSFLTNHEVVYSSNVNWRLGSWIQNPDEFDVCIHFAHSKGNANENILGTRILCEQFKNKMIYISSISAHLDSRSVYASTKYRCEEIVKLYSGTTISPGVFLINEVNGLIQFLNRIPRIIPSLLIPFSRTPIGVTHCQDFVEMISACISSASIQSGQSLKCYSRVTTIREIRTNNRRHIKSGALQTDVCWRLALRVLRFILPKETSLIDKMTTIAYPPYWLSLEHVKSKNSK